MTSQLKFDHRLARRSDMPDLRELMELAIRKMMTAYLSPAEIEASFDVMGVDTTLIDDGTYFVIQYQQQIVGCGGWSRRATLYGGDATAGRNASLLNPTTDSARVRAMYTHPDFARHGIGRRLLLVCEQAAKQEGFSSVELMSTLAGESLYSAAGYRVVERVQIPTSNEITLSMARMHKLLA